MTQLLEDRRPKTKTCLFCKGSGRCAKCGGQGTHVVRKGRLGLRRVVSCNACERSGLCGLCEGEGTVKDTP